MAAARKRASAKRSDEKKRIQEEKARELEKRRQLRQEIGLWIVMAVSLLLFIGNLGFGGVVGSFFSGILLGLFGMVAYIFPVLLMVGSVFFVSNRGNAFAAVKLISVILIFLFGCTFVALIMTGVPQVGPADAFVIGREDNIGGGLLGGTVAYLLASAFGKAGAYVVTTIGMIVAIVLLTGRLAMRGMRDKGVKAYSSAVEHQQMRRARRQEERESILAVDSFTVGPAKAGEGKTKPGKGQKSDPLDLRAAARAAEEEKRTSDTQKPQERKKRLKRKRTDSMTELKPGMEFESADVQEEQQAGDGFPESSQDDVSDSAIDFVEPKITGYVVKSLRSEDGDTVVTDSGSGQAASEAEHIASDRPASAQRLSPERISPVVPEVERIAPERPASAQRLSSERISPVVPEVERIAPGRPASAQGTFPEHIAPERPVSAQRPSAGADSERPIPAQQAAVQTAPAVSEEVQKEPPREYIYPSVELLSKVKNKGSGNSEQELMDTAMKLQQTLKTFGVNVKVTDISCGPAVTRYEIQPEMGVKVSKIVNLADDIKLNLAAADIRIEAPIPGKAAVGIEVPNKENVMVSFRELIESDEFQKAKSKISFAVGRDIGGKVMVSDIAKMPHVLIAGATGSGKSVCINTIIMSILYKAKPDEVKLIMIDPKVVELSVYNGVPHLMIPVVTDPKKAAGALNWAVQEMTDRYNKFAETGVRKFEEYNAKIDKLDISEGQSRPEKMCQLVIIVDELADLMMVASHEVEDAICRLAQLARAAGIHLVIATQRPSVNVITGLIKANMPSRIAFAVTSGIDSRTILDMNGAEKLLGKGDMLFNPQGVPKPLRVQGAFVSDDEVSAVVGFLKENNGGASYDSSIQKKMESLQNEDSAVAIDGAEPDDGRDSYFDEAAQIIVDKEKASIGMLQRYLKVGFNRAARIMDQLEEAGIVGPEEGTKPRKVLMTPEEYSRLGGVPEEIP